jgi:hypothetical protein
MTSHQSDWDYYEVEELLERKQQGNKTFYLVKWVNYDTSESTWEPEDNLDPTTVKKFNDHQSQKKGKSNKKQQVLKPVKKKPVVVTGTEEPKIAKKPRKIRDEVIHEVYRAEDTEESKTAQEIKVKIVDIVEGNLIWEVVKDGEAIEMSTSDARKVACQEMLDYFMEKIVVPQNLQ